jgi:hypothetical protein
MKKLITNYKSFLESMELAGHGQELNSNTDAVDAQADEALRLFQLSLEGKLEKGRFKKVFSSLNDDMEGDAYNTQEVEYIFAIDNYEYTMFFKYKAYATSGTPNTYDSLGDSGEISDQEIDLLGFGVADTTTRPHTDIVHSDDIERGLFQNAAVWQDAFTKLAYNVIS